MIAVSACLSITAAMMFLVLLGFGVLLAVSIHSSFSVTTQPQASIYHTAERFQLALSEGLAVPLVGFPVAAVISGFLLLIQRPWARIVHTVLGVAALAWSFWWLHTSPAWWLPASVYIVLGVVILWTSGVGRWYAARAVAVSADSTQPWPPHR